MPWPDANPAFPRLLDESLTDLQQEILRVEPRLLHGSRVIAMFQRYFLHYQVHCDLWSVSAPDQRACPFSEGWARILRRRRRTVLGRAFVLSKFRGCQTIVGIPGILVSEQSGNRESPMTARTGPAHIRIALNPDQRTCHISPPAGVLPIANQISHLLIFAPESASCHILCFRTCILDSTAAHAQPSHE